MTAVFPQPLTGRVVAAGIAFVALSLWPVLALVPGPFSRLMATFVLLILMVSFIFEIRGGSLLGLSERIRRPPRRSGRWPWCSRCYPIKPAPHEQTTR